MDKTSKDPELRHLNPLPKENWDESLRHVLDDMRGRPLNIHGLMANNPTLLKAWWGFRNYAVNGGALSRREGELVILRVAARLKNWYEWASHAERGLAVGLSLEEIQRVKSNPSADDWSASDRALLRAVDDCLDHKSISDAVRADLEMHFSDAQIMDVIAIQGMYVILGAMINTWGLELEPNVALPEGLENDF